MTMATGEAPDDDLSEAVTVGVEAYISEAYARAERDKLWRKVWLQVGRASELVNVGDYITYEVLDDSIVIVRAASDELRAYHNVCQHRGRRLIDCAEREKHARGRALPVTDGGPPQLTCRYHGWRYGLDGKNTRVVHKEDWNGALKNECIRLAKVNIDTWGGWMWINMDPDCEPLCDYLAPAPSMLDPFQLQNMRYRWRKWGVFDCNWKVAIEAFNETYHVQSTHPEFNAFGEFRGWARVQGKHSNIGYDAPKGVDENQQAKLRVGTGDARISTAELQTYTWEKANTNTTETLVNAAQRQRRCCSTGSRRRAVMTRHAACSGRSSSPRTSARAAPPGRSFRTFRSATP
jgi:phenylpropionate dioxygenase-like ring-hydroxylating dioxygenase large terminal subunit